MSKKKILKDNVSTECDIIDESIDNELLSEKPKRGRGRPRRVSTECIKDDLSGVKLAKVIGECINPDCTCACTELDYEDDSKKTLSCVRCGTIQRVDKLLPIKKKSSSRNVYRSFWDRPNIKQTEVKFEVESGPSIPKEFANFSFDENDY